MPRNGSSVYSLPAGNPVVPGTVIATTWANNTLTDIATALTNSLSTDGSTATVSMAGKTINGGTFASPTVSGIQDLVGGRIKFPAVQVSSADPNTLDDYEEGTWTPAITFNVPGNLAVTYTSRVGIYTKIGQLITIGCTIFTATFTHTTASGALFVSGLPFAANASGMNNSMGGCMGGWDLGTARQYISTYLQSGTNALQFFLNGTTRANTAGMTTAQHFTGDNVSIETNLMYHA